MLIQDPSPLIEETVRHLQALIRLETVNPPGNEILAAEYLADVLRGEGYDPVVLESAPGRGNMVVRYAGNGELPPLLLLGHTDVVPAEPEHWQHPPFGGDIAEGCVWGRGAVDMKGAVAMELAVMLALARSEAPLRRDVIFAATADEEAGGHFGIGWLVDHHPDLVRAEYALTEFGGFSLDLDGHRVYPCQTAEKGTCQVRLRAHGRPGHGSVPHRDNAIVHLAEAICKLRTGQLGMHVTPTARAFIEGMAEVVGGSRGLLLRQLLRTSTHDLALAALPDEGMRAMLAAVLHNTASPTMLSAGSKINVIPSQAEASLDGRLLPGQTAQDFVAELRQLVGPDVEIDVVKEVPALEMPRDTPLWETLRHVLQAHDPEGTMIPFLLTGGTDAKHLARLGITTYGFTPLRFPSGFDLFSLAHSHDERLPIEALAWGLPVLIDVVHSFCR